MAEQLRKLIPSSQPTISPLFSHGRWFCIILYTGCRTDSLSSQTCSCNMVNHLDRSSKTCLWITLSKSKCAKLCHLGWPKIFNLQQESTSNAQHSTLIDTVSGSPAAELYILWCLQLNYRHCLSGQLNLLSSCLIRLFFMSTQKKLKLMQNLKNRAVAMLKKCTGTRNWVGLSIWNQNPIPESCFVISYDRRKQNNWKKVSPLCLYATFPCSQTHLLALLLSCLFFLFLSHHNFPLSSSYSKLILTLKNWGFTFLLKGMKISTTWDMWNME